MSHYLALWAASRRPLLDLMRVDVRHAPWRDLIAARLLVWRPHRRSPWLGEPPGRPRRARPVLGEVDLTPGAWGVLADIGFAEAVTGEITVDRPHHAEGRSLIQGDFAVLADASAWSLGGIAARLARNATVFAAVRPVCDGSPGGIPCDDPAVGRWFRRPHPPAGDAP